MERGQPCPRGVLAKLLTTRGLGCPRSFREILESAVPFPSAYSAYFAVWTAGLRLNSTRRSGSGQQALKRNKFRAPILWFLESALPRFDIWIFGILLSRLPCYT